MTIQETIGFSVRPAAARWIQDRQRRHSAALDRWPSVEEKSEDRGMKGNPSNDISRRMREQPHSSTVTRRVLQKCVHDMAVIRYRAGPRKPNALLPQPAPPGTGGPCAPI